MEGPFLRKLRPDEIKPGSLDERLAKIKGISVTTPLGEVVELKKPDQIETTPVAEDRQARIRGLIDNNPHGLDFGGLL